MGVKIVLIDDHKIMREGLHILLEKEHDLEVVGEADNGRDSIPLVERLLPDIVIMDVAMPDLNGIEATRQIVRKFPRIKIIALSMHSDHNFIQEMLRAGACAYLLKYNAFNDLARAIRCVLEDKVYLSPEIAKLMLKDFVSSQYQSQRSLPKVFQILTPREREVLQFLAEGNPTKHIARRLKVSIKTIETHRQQIMHKLNLHSVAELTKYAIREGLTSL